jgi:hypothetical protein
MMDLETNRSSSLKPVETAVMLLFLPLLRSVDIDVYHEVVVRACQKCHPNGLSGGIETLSGIVAKHVTTWFCNAFCGTSTNDRITISSRIADVCISSHPLMPLYLAAAMLSTRKQQSKNNRLYSWNVEEDFHIQIESLFYIDRIAENPSGSIEVYEGVAELIIKTAIDFM